MELVIKNPPVKTTKNNALFKKLNILGGLLLTLIVSMIVSTDILKVLALTGTIILTTFLVEFLYALNEKKISKFTNWKFYIGPLSLALTLTLIMPLGSSIYMAVIAAVVATYLGKLVFGGEGYNIFNPAVLGFGFILVSFTTKLNNFYAKLPLNTLKGIANSGGNGIIFDTGELLLGNYLGSAIGVTCSVLLIALLVYYMVMKIIDWKISLVYVVSCAVMALLVAVVCGDTLGSTQPLDFMIYHLLAGSILFAAVFLLSDNPSSPTTRESKIIFAVIAAVFTMAVRLIGTYDEGVIFAVLLANMLAPVLSSSFKRSNNKNLIITTVVSVLLVVGFSVVLGLMVKNSIQDTQVVARLLGGVK